jgi:beta-lactamase class A
MVLLLLVTACDGRSMPLVPGLPALPSFPTNVAGQEQQPRADTVELTTRVDALLASFSGGAAVWVADAGDRRPLYAKKADEVVLAASLYKLALLVHVESLVERGQGRYTDTITVEAQDITADGSLVLPGGSVTIDEALDLMITQSDNGTALALWRTYGGDAVNASLARERIGGIHVARDANDDNTVTARGVGELMRRLAERRLVSRAASDRMLARLERQTITGRADALLPGGTRIAHKTGDIVGASHDAAIVWTARGPRVVVVLTWEAAEGKAHELIAKVALAAFETAR